MAGEGTRTRAPIGASERPAASPWTEARRAGERGVPAPRWTLATAAVLALLIAATDPLVPLGVAHGVLYVGVVLLTLWTPRRSDPLVAAGICTVLTVVGALLSPAGGVPWMVAANRVLALGAIWVSGVLCWQRKRRGHQHAEELGRQLGRSDRLEGELERQREASAELEARLWREHGFAEGLLDVAPMIVLVLDTEARIVRFNRYLENLSGWSLDEVQGRDWFGTFLPAREHDRIRDVFARTAAGVRNHSAINPILTRDGSERTIEWAGTALRDAAGRITGVLSTGQDITDRRRLEEDFLQAQKMEAIGRLAGGIAHDFNNLLMGIVGCCRMARGQLPAAGPARRHLEEIEAAAGKAVGLTRQLLDFSRRRPSEVRPIDLNTVVSDKRPMLAPLLGEDIELRFDLDPSQPVVKADLVQLEQILMNLVVNARDAMHDGGTLTVTTAVLRPGEDHGPHLAGPSITGPRAQLVVSDTGTGIAPADQQKVFEPFYTTKEPGKGTGLGLATVYGLVEQLGGHVHLESQVGHGATFRVCLPLEGPGPGPASPDAETAGASGRGDGEVVLLVEDERLVRLGVRHDLQSAGYRVLDAGEPEEALRLCEEHDGPIDLLLTDMVMPGMSGSELAERVRAEHPDCGVLFMSAYPAEELIGQGRIAPGTVTLEKPFSEEDLWGRVRRALSRARAPEPPRDEPASP